MSTPPSVLPPSDSLPTRTVLMVASEVLPFAKTGGLADVMSSLPQAIGKLGFAVTVVMPRYRGVNAGAEVDRFEVPFPGGPFEVGIWETPIATNVRAVFIDCPALYDREALYGTRDDDYADSPRRFAILAYAALEFSRRAGSVPDIVHAHDWQAGLAPVYLKVLAAHDAAFDRTAAIFTIHNLAYQGLCAAQWLPQIGLDPSLFTVDGLEYWGRVSFLKGGVNFSDLVTTVSPTYAQEIQTPEYGFGFEGILAARSADLIGVLNGIDTDRWNPADDPHLPVPYDENTVTEGKRAAKAEVLRAYRLPVDESTLQRPLIGIISRLVDQKGFDIVAAMDALGGGLAGLGATFVVLGTGEARYQDFWLGLASRHPASIGVNIGFDEPLAHLIEAGADMFLMPSRFEPCGLNQMYSLRYGTIPVVRATGGLKDTVVDADPSGSEGTGFTFAPYTPEALRGALERALAIYQNPSVWKALRARGMLQNFSWDRSAREYVKLYERALARKRGEPAV